MQVSAAPPAAVIISSRNKTFLENAFFVISPLRSMYKLHVADKLFFGLRIMFDDSAQHREIFRLFELFKHFKTRHESDKKFVEGKRRYVPHRKSCFSPRIRNHYTFSIGFTFPESRISISRGISYEPAYNRTRESIFPGTIYPLGFTSQFKLVRGTLNPPLCLVLSGSHHFTRVRGARHAVTVASRSVAGCKLHLSSRWETRPLGGFAVKSAGRHDNCEWPPRNLRRPLQRRPRGIFRNNVSRHWLGKKKKGKPDNFIGTFITTKIRKKSARPKFLKKKKNILQGLILKVQGIF